MTGARGRGMMEGGSTMRIAVLSDIHANLPALLATLAAVDGTAADVVVVAGDIVNRGPSSLACLERILQRRERHGWRLLKGNHEDFVVREAEAPPNRPDWLRKLYAHTRWTLERVREHLPLLRALPDHVELEGPDGSQLRFTHASMRGNRHGLYEDMDEGDLGELIAPPPRVLTVGHTHIPFIRTVDATLVVNAGAAGLPFDGDTRASFAVLDWSAGAWRARIVRVPYDHEAAEAAFHNSGYLDDAGPMAPLILDELRQARPRLGWWHRHYERSVAAGELTIEESVERLLDDARDRARIP